MLIVSLFTLYLSTIYLIMSCFFLCCLFFPIYIQSPLEESREWGLTKVQGRRCLIDHIYKEDGEPAVGTQEPVRYMFTPTDTVSTSLSLYYYTYFLLVYSTPSPLYRRLLNPLSLAYLSFTYIWCISLLFLSSSPLSSSPLSYLSLSYIS